MGGEIHTEAPQRDRKMPTDIDDPFAILDRIDEEWNMIWRTDHDTFFL
jgi:hypothetical protein